MKKILAAALFLFTIVLSAQSNESTKFSGNPIIQGRYADPEGIIFGKEYWIYPTYSDVYEKQVFLDAFSSKDLITWEKHSSVIDPSIVKWAHKAI